MLLIWCLNAKSMSFINRFNFITPSICKIKRSNFSRSVTGINTRLKEHVTHQNRTKKPGSKYDRKVSELNCILRDAQIQVIFYVVLPRNISKHIKLKNYIFRK